MRTVHAYTPAQQQQQQEQQQQQASSSTSQPTLHQHSSTSGYPSVRHSLLRMHSQLRSAPNGRESTQGPIDLSLYRLPRQPPKMAARSTSTANTALRTIPTITPLANPPTHTIYSNAVPSSFTSSKTATSINNQEQNTKMQNSCSTSVTSKCSYSRPAPIPSPKLAYSYSNIEENLQCPLCIDRLRDPRALPCQHVFCCSCLKSIPSSNIPYPTIVCPLCRRTFPYNGADQFPISYIHRQLLELVPKNYDINGKCTKCQEKGSLILCSCCDFLLCQKCFMNDREKLIDNIQHIVQTCYHRLNRIHTTRDQLNDLNELNRKKIQQIEAIFSNFERKFFEHKQSIINSLNKYNVQITNHFWSKLNISTRNTTEPFIDLLKQAELFIQKSHTIQFDDIVSLFRNLNSINEQLEYANSLIDTYDVQNLLKQTIRINNYNLDEQTCVHLNQIDSTEKILPLLPSTILPRSTKRLRKTEPKRHIEQNNDEEEYDDNDDDNLPILKQMKVEYHNDMNFDPSSSPTNSVLCLNFSNNEHQQDELDNDDDIIYIETIQAKSPATISFEELFQMIGTEE
ncbi:unnamed protein product [Rotaria sp. Silwood1]|nr:unnamed protein product [Rotaria sp. Silwood1]CAF3561140.1 unnamed protein product [Rotaria sp. Silwood1]CAF4658545.1 unnamed protein product [Rotaria sp. Silwood1]